MSLLILREKKMDIGTIVERDCPVKVVEIKQQISPADRLKNNYIKIYNENKPESFQIPLISERLVWWHRVEKAD